MLRKSKTKWPSQSVHRSLRSTSIIWTAHLVFLLRTTEHSLKRTFICFHWVDVNKRTQNVDHYVLCLLSLITHEISLNTTSTQLMPMNRSFFLCAYSLIFIYYSKKKEFKQNPMFTTR